MRKLLIMGLLLIGAIAFAGKYEDEMTERMKDAQEKAQAGWDSGVRADMINASLDLDTEWEKEMNKVYDLILKKLPAKEKVKFKAEQQKWIKDRKVKVQKAYDKYTKEEGPRMAGELAANEKLSITKERALELAKRYDKMNVKK
ncbi:lysozyme inhibitor LprI family protein [Leptotrichia massiliensis]|uniref:lysozyme inhibitor LprI family protein n=1 Tax=Leptotrichia massiliensis TaxID=1852388 RepID=UPI0028D5E291|nr:lysozyme inhibitor LprI family protein [Leptotrichia massiliensis]